MVQGGASTGSSEPTSTLARKRYTRIVDTPEGDSAFEDAELPLVERQLADGVPPMLQGPLPPVAAVAFVRSGEFDSVPHPAPQQQWVVMLRGSIQVEVSDGTRRRFGPGDLLLAADTAGRGHVTLAAGDPPFEALVIPYHDQQNP